jgi:hypothetical protein
MKKDNIEEIYSELKSFAQEPPKELWDNIQARLHPKKKRRGAFWLWGSAAAILMLMLAYTFYKPSNDGINIPINEPVKEISNTKQPNDETDNVTDQSDIINDEIVTSKTSKDSIEEKIKTTNNTLQQPNHNQFANSETSQHAKNNNEDNKLNKSLIKENVKNESKIAKTIDGKSRDNIKSKQDKNNELIPNLLKKKEGLIEKNKETAIAGVDSITTDKTDVKLDLYEELMAERSNEKDSVNTDVANNNKWSVEILGGLSNTASDASFQQTSVNTSPQNDFVYAFKVGYSISDKVQIKTGVGKNNLGQQVNNIAYATADGSLSSNEGQTIVSDESLVFFGSTELASNDASFNEFSENGTLQQQLDYVQVPLEVFYKLLAKEKYDVLLGVGGNVNFISDNKAYLNGGEIGENIGVDNTIFGATLSTNFSYYLSKKTVLFLEPSYNYFEKPIDNNAQNFKNTQLRILFGLQFKL